jgi:hypothetical protein
MWRKSEICISYQLNKFGLLTYETRNVIFCRPVQIDHKYGLQKLYETFLYVKN